MKNLFVYGTLRKGETRSAYLLPCRLERAIKIPGILYNTPFDCPVAVFDKTSKNSIHGELYRLPAEVSDEFIRRIDLVEGADIGLFERSVVSFSGDRFYPPIKL